MTRIIEHRQDAAPGEELFELRVFQLRDGDVRACVVPADLAVDLDVMADMSEPVAQAYLDALALCETESVATLWVHDPLGLSAASSHRLRGATPPRPREISRRSARIRSPCSDSRTAQSNKTKTSQPAKMPYLSDKFTKMGGRVLGLSPARRDARLPSSRWSHIPRPRDPGKVAAGLTAPRDLSPLRGDYPRVIPPAQGQVLAPHQA